MARLASVRMNRCWEAFLRPLTSCFIHEPDPEPIASIDLLAGTHPVGVTRFGAEAELRLGDGVVALGRTAVTKVDVKEAYVIPRAHLHVGA
jgi:hypothetical protein